jgi:hypothetical protein
LENLGIWWKRRRRDNLRLNPQETAMTNGTVELATHAFLMALVKTMMEQGVISKPLVQQALTTAYAVLESDPDEMSLRSRVILEGLEPYFGL